MEHRETGFEIKFHTFGKLGFSVIKVYENNKLVFDIVMTPGQETIVEVWIPGKWEEKTYGSPEMF